MRHYYSLRPGHWTGNCSALRVWQTLATYFTIGCIIRCSFVVVLQRKDVIVLFSRDNFPLNFVYSYTQGFSEVQLQF